MATPRSFIIVKGQPKALQIDKIDLERNGVFVIKFKNSPKYFHYRRSDVIILTDTVWHDHLHLKVYTNGKEEHNIADVRSFSHGQYTHWRITYGNGFIKDYLHGTIQVVHSCLEDVKAKNSFEYLNRIAQINELGKDEEHGGILPQLYEKIDFIDDQLAIAPVFRNEPHKSLLGDFDK